MTPTTSTFIRTLTKVLKPLAQMEATRAIKVAIHYLEPELVRDGISRYRVLGAELAITRPKSPRVIPKRQIEVIVIDYLNRRHIRVVVEQGRVVEVRTLDYQPAVSGDEIAEATQLAASVPELRKLAGRKGVFVSHYAPGPREPGERRIGLYYLSTGKNGLVAILAAAELDLVEQRVLAIRLPGKGSMMPIEGGAYGKLR
jgi:hypothetical protein